MASSEWLAAVSDRHWRSRFKPKYMNGLCVLVPRFSRAHPGPEPQGHLPPTLLTNPPSSSAPVHFKICTARPWKGDYLVSLVDASRHAVRWLLGNCFLQCIDPALNLAAVAGGPTEAS